MSKDCFLLIGPVCWQTCAGSNTYDCANVACTSSESACTLYLALVATSVITLGSSLIFTPELITTNFCETTTQ